MLNLENILHRLRALVFGSWSESGQSAASARSHILRIVTLCAVIVIQFIGEDDARKDKKVLVKSRKDARELVRKLKGDLEDHGEVVLDAQGMTFKELAAVFENKG